MGEVAEAAREADFGDRGVRACRFKVLAHGFEPLVTSTHAKVFTARYYAERFGGYDDRVAALLERALDGVGLSDQLVAPDLRDRMQVLARRA